ncbi:DUF4433 domain-containing protein [Mesorhizobium sp. M00.F.Ca.ET.216.01.1.1]|nr:DUF4433 domain-containing protein [Mesorhizobium sp. M00.F.Ca.ET.216.01.1.1]TJW03143.1 MAG: DUF4433 domain-containing protein [Mesorhizobium sp.]
MGFRERIRHEAVRRGIPYLVHFTQAWNLPSIVTHGLLSRTELAERNLNVFLSDRSRLDEKDEAISVSISGSTARCSRRSIGTVGPPLG